MPSFHAFHASLFQLMTSLLGHPSPVRVMYQRLRSWPGKGSSSKPEGGLNVAFLPCHALSQATLCLLKRASDAECYFLPGGVCWACPQHTILLVVVADLLPRGASTPCLNQELFDSFQHRKKVH